MGPMAIRPVAVPDQPGGRGAPPRGAVGGAAPTLAPQTRRQGGPAARAGLMGDGGAVMPR